jgi:hypothetical protein
VAFEEMRYGDSRVLFEEVLLIRRQEFPGGKKNLLRVVHNLANVMNKLGNSEKKLLLMEEAVIISRKVFRYQHQETAACLERVGWIFMAKRNYIGAQSVAEEALEI